MIFLPMLALQPYQLNADAVLVNIAFLLQPLSQVASLVTEKQVGWGSDDGRPLAHVDP